MLQHVASKLHYTQAHRSAVSGPVQCRAHDSARAAPTRPPQCHGHNRRGRLRVCTHVRAQALAHKHIEAHPTLRIAL